MAVVESAKPKAPFQVIADSLSDLMAGKPINADSTLGAFQEIMGSWAPGIGAGYHPEVRAGETEGQAHRRAQGPVRSWWEAMQGQGSAQRPPPPPPDPEEEQRRAAVLAARRTMGFTSSEVLLEDDVKKRLRELAKKHHPDRGGKAATMAKINDAADVLRADLAR